MTVSVSADRQERYRRSEGIEAAPMQDETILYNPSTNKFCVLNQTAAFLWDLLEEPRTQNELSTRLAAGFGGVDGSVAARDVTRTLQQFADLDMVVLLK